MRPDEGFGRGTLQEGSGLRVEDFAHEVVRGRVPDGEGDGPIEGHEFYEVGRAKVTVFHRRIRRQSLSPKLEKIAKEDPDVVLRKVDIVKWRTPVTQQFKINSVPNVWVIDGSGRQVGKATSGFSSIRRNVAAAKQRSGL